MALGGPPDGSRTARVNEPDSGPQIRLAHNGDSLVSIHFVVYSVRYSSGRGAIVAQRHRVKISATIDPELLDGIDAYIKEHPGRDRSKVIDEALMLWLAQEQDRAMIEQYAEDDRPADEVAAWRAIQDAAARRTFGRGER